MTELEERISKLEDENRILKDAIKRICQRITIDLYKPMEISTKKMKINNDIKGQNDD